ncbi:MAG: type II toxin-antitoxin system Phd/YefM family antitoxin [Bauldia sp.]
MTITISSRQFNQDRSGIKKLAEEGPVFITDRGRPAHVLMTIEEYRRITGKPMTLLEALTPPGEGDLDFEPPRLSDKIFRPADFD